MYVFLPLVYYRATLCVSVVYAVARCPSVRHARACIQTSEYIVIFLCIGPVAPSLVFFDPSAGTQFQGERTLSARAQNTREWESTEITVYLGNGRR